MKSRNILIASFAALFLASSCSDVMEPEEIVKANPGDEVVFGAALPATKTVYGEETSTGFPIYWVNGDKVRVASPQCLSGRNSAEYVVAVESTTQNYATSLTKTGDAGVQWGEAEKADFYSIYPSSASTKLEVSGEGVTTTLHVDETQFASTSTKNNGKSDYLCAQPAEMGNVVMYAKTVDAPSGEPVALRYTPFSTVLEFEINAPTQSAADKQTEITIQTLTLTAPTGTTIAGDFDFTFPTGESTTPSITPATTGGSNAITMHFLDNNSQYAELSTNKPQLKAKMCLMPISGNLDGWNVEVKTNVGTFSKTLGATDSKGTNTTLDPGKVHKIKLPTLNYASQEWTYNTANWITSLPDYTNIYLSELSLPGAWYAGATEGVDNGTGYQATSNITDLWNAGVRAFAVECRSYTERTGFLGGGNLANSNPSRIVLSGTGTDKNGAYTSPAFGSCTYLSSIISSVAGSIHSDEYGVLVLSYADGGDGGHRALDYQYFINGIANEITQSGATNIYSGTIDKNTTVNDVLGKLIIKINVDAKILIGSYGSNQNYLMSYNPFLSQLDASTYEHPRYSNLYWKTWSDDYKTAPLLLEIQNNPAVDAENMFIWVFSSANRTQTDTNGASDLPTYSNRKTALGSMMSFSKTVYERSYHNVWFYFNCGGTEATTSSGGSPSPTAFAKAMNAWLLEQLQIKIGDKVNSNGVFAPDPSPLGMVMFNQCTNATYNGPAIINAIIEMNSKFYLKHAGTTGGSTGGNATPTATNDATVWSGGKAI